MEVKARVKAGQSAAVGGGQSSKKAERYTVIYLPGEDGKFFNSSPEEQVEKGKVPSHIPIVVPDEGYTFAGWSMDGEGTVQPGTVVIREDTVFTAVYKEQHEAYIRGYEDGSFRPDTGISRAETAVLFVRISQKEPDANSCFADVPAGSWYESSIETSASNGWVEGDGDGNFRPEESITRGEFAAIAARYLRLSGGSKKEFGDCEGHWARGYIGALAEQGILEGYGDGSFRPDAKITRAEAVKILNGILGREPACGDVSNPFPDVAATHWAYSRIAEAAVSHTTQ